MYNTSEGQQRIAQAIAAMWKDVLGVDTTIVRQDYRGYLEAIGRETPLEEMPHVWRAGWCGSYPDHHAWLYEVFHAEQGDGRTRAMRSRFEEYLEAALLESDPGARKALHREAEKILIEDEARMTPIYYYTTAVLTKPWVTHRVFADMGGTPWFQWRLDWELKKRATGM
jgi:oligopeptide transport system substrate-binding protein